MNIKKEIKKQEEKILKAKQALKMEEMELRHMRDRCPHVNTKKWTNNDGYGQFIVERCLDCGAQEDGGLRR